MRDFRTLKVWKKAHDLTLDTYSLTASFPHDEKYGLTSQLRRAMSSVPSNIAEGCGRNGIMDFKRFLEIAMGSACEVEYQLLLAYELKYMNDSKYAYFQKNIVQIKRMLSVYVNRIKAGKDVMNVHTAKPSSES